MTFDPKNSFKGSKLGAITNKFKSFRNLIRGAFR